MPSRATPLPSLEPSEHGTGDIVPFPSPTYSLSRTDAYSSATSDSLPGGALERTRQITKDLGGPLRPIYRTPEALDPTFVRARALIAEALELFEQALEYHREEDTLAADDLVTRAGMIFPELFCCRALGDGFSDIAGALILGFRNSRGIPLTDGEIIGFKIALQALEQEPFLSRRAADEVLERAEEYGLESFPEEFDEIADLGRE